MHINSLPDDVLVKVFSKISLLELEKTVRHTCLRWRSLSFDSYLWRVVHLILYDLTDELLVPVTECSDAIEDLKILSNDCFKQIHFPKLKRLQFLNCDSYDDLKNLICTYPSLKNFILVSDESNIGSLQDIMKLKNLCHLEIRSLLKSDTGIDLTADTLAGFPNLYTLTLHDTEIRDDVINGVFRGSPHLKNLSLSWDHLTINAFRDLSPLDNRLESLVLSSARSLTDEDLLYIVNKMPHLKSLELENLHYVTDKCIVNLAGTCRDLESLEISGDLALTDEGMKAIADGCQNLRKIVLPFTPDIGDTGIGYVAEHCANLEQVNFQQCSILDDSILSLALYASNLKVLSLCLINNITGYAISQVVINCRQLSELTVEGCSDVKELNFDDFHQKMTPFGHQPLPDCTAACLREEREFLASGHSREIGKSCCQTDYNTHLERRPVFSHLKEIRLPGTPITNSSFMQIARHCPDLVTLIAWVRNLRDESTLALTKNCRPLCGVYTDVGDGLTKVRLGRW